MDKALITIISIIVVLISLTFHEAAHALAAFLLGDPTARNRGRMSLNPIVHIDPIGTVFLPLILAISGAGVFGWAKPVPVDLAYVKNPKRDHGLIAAAGPGANLLLAMASAVLARLVIIFQNLLSAELSQFLFTAFLIGIHINILLMIFNILPLPPLDGAAILEAFLSPEAAFKMNKLHQYGFIILFILIFTNILDSVYLSPVGGTIIKMIKAATGLN